MARTTWALEVMVRSSSQDDAERFAALAHPAESASATFLRLLRTAADAPPATEPGFETVVLRQRLPGNRHFAEWSKPVGPLTPEDAVERIAQLERKGWEVQIAEVEARPRVVVPDEEPDEEDVEPEAPPLAFYTSTEWQAERRRHAARRAHA
jgi:hypothetical protein